MTGRAPRLVVVVPVRDRSLAVTARTLVVVIQQATVYGGLPVVGAEPGRAVLVGVHPGCLALADHRRQGLAGVVGAHDSSSSRLIRASRSIAPNVLDATDSHATPGWAPRASSRSRAVSCTHPGRRDSGELSLAAVLAWDSAAAAAIPFPSPIAVSHIAASLICSGLVVMSFPSVRVLPGPERPRVC